MLTKEQEKQYLETIDQVIAQGPYSADWGSLSEWTPPEWFSRAKFGIFIHWGLYSVAAHANEWYSRNMYIQEKEEWEYHRKTFGAHTEFGYKDFIPGFTAEKFDPEEWIRLFKQAGAGYLFPVAEHHDGFQMYRSEISRYNAWDMGPKRDILGELKAAAEKEGMIFCTSSHRAEHWWFMGHGREFASDIREPLARGDFYWPAMQEPQNMELQSKPYPTEEYLTDWLLRTCELIDRYQPSLLYFDWWVQHEAFRGVLKKLVAYYYNRAAQRGKKAAVCYKYDALMFGSGIVEVERGALAAATPYLWQTDTAIAKNSWCYTDTLDYKTPRQIICTLIEAVSKNGNLLLNVGPKGDGSIPERDQEILREIGAWMEKNGEAIYGSKPWRRSMEGKTNVAEGHFTDNEEPPYTAEDIRFTVRGDCIYAFVMKFPRDGRITIRSLAYSDDQGAPVFHGLIREVCLLGFSVRPDYRVDEKGLHIRAGEIKTDFPVAVKIRVL